MSTSKAIIDELCEIALAHVEESKKTLLQKYELRLNAAAEAREQTVLKALKIEKDVKALEIIDEEIEQLQDTINEKRRVKERFGQDISAKLDSSLAWKNFRNWEYGESRAKSILKEIKKNAEKQAMYDLPEVGSVIAELDKLADNVRERMLLATSTVEVRAVVTQIIEKIDSLLK